MDNQSSIMTTEPLIGRIEHRLDLSHHSSDFTKKRRRREERTSAVNVVDETGPSITVTHNAGIYFVDESLSLSSQHQHQLHRCGHLLQVPTSLAKTVCDAIRYQRRVRISPPWTMVELLLSTKTKTTTKTTETADLVLEAQRVEIIDPSELLDGGWDTANAATLTEWRDEEQESFNNNNNNSTSTIIATVEALSPIIAVVPKDPFCLMEIYHDNNNNNNDETVSCLVVIKGQAALVCHAGIQPGNVLQLVRSKMKRQRWTVPEVLHKTYPHVCVPRRVLVVTDPMAIVWNQQDGKGLSAVAPTVPMNMSIIEGTLSRVVETSAGLQSVELTNDGDRDSATNKRRVLLLLSHFPMSTNLQYSLRKGTIVRATNVHFVASYTESSSSSTTTTVQYYGACLRSTVSLLGLASSPRGNSSNSSSMVVGDANSVTTAMHIKEGAVPWKYGRIQKSLYNQALLCHVKDKQHVRVTKHFKSLSAQAIVTGLMEVYCQQQREARGSSLLQAWAIQSDTVASNSKRRDQFAEFLDHGVDKSDEGNEPASATPVPGNCGCHMSHIDPPVFPTIVTVSQIKGTLLGVLEKRLEKWIRKAPAKSKIPGGSVASIQMSCIDMIDAITEPNAPFKRTADSLLCVVGNLSATGESGKIWLLGDSTCCCPITTKESYSLPEGSDYQRVVGNPSVCLASALCLGPTSVSTGEQKYPGLGASSYSLVNLEPWEKRPQLPKEGSCAILDCHGYLFLVSIHIHFKTVAAACENAKLPVGRKEPLFSTVEQMLDPEYPIQVNSFFAGILCRQRLKFIKIKSGLFHGTMLTLAHCSTPQRPAVDISSVSTIQSLELNIATQISDQNKAILINCMQRLSSQSRTSSLLPEQLNLAAAWWKMSDGTSSALIACGIDEIVKSETELHQSTSSRFVPCVVVPTSAWREGSNGFVRFKCNLDDIRVSLVEVNTVPLPLSDVPRQSLHCLGSQKHLQGMLDRLAYRRKRSCGENEASGFPGVQCVTLGDMHKAICADIRNCSQTRLAPSMVRLVRGARFLAVAYCRIRVECTRCHRPLVRRSKNNAKSLSGVLDCVQLNPQPSFWSIQIRLDGSTAPQKEESRHYVLHCSNHCPINCSEVKWECSGLLDDGTGQGKLYSERESALKLLGIDSEIAGAIEEGAWEMEAGICYQKAMPPSTYIKEAIREARMAVSQQTKGRKASATDILRLLKPSARAIYLLHQHCANVSNATRDVDYLVRCKPLSTAAFHLNRTEVQTTTSEALTTDAAVYSLPPLKLNLSDMT